MRSVLTTIDATARSAARSSLSLPFLIYLNFVILLPGGWFQNGFPRLVLLLVFGGGMLACLVLLRGFALLEAALARTGTLWRLILFMIAALLLIMTGSTAHDDYMIWWMPAALAAFARKSEEQLAETPMATMPLAAAG